MRCPHLGSIRRWKDAPLSSVWRTVAVTILSPAAFIISIRPIECWCTVFAVPEAAEYGDCMYTEVGERRIDYVYPYITHRLLLEDGNIINIM